ncbi:MAG: type II toxin-antitoxin system VapC family toxin [Cytophagales bacterium]|nr:MAG: type II toxin-antitoxin system VapC family toxin [Cytophagales bacterium]
MKLFDSNLIIYSASDQYEFLRGIISEADSCVSSITKVEALGYHKLPALDKDYFETLFATINVIPLTETVIDKAVELRQQKRMSLGDCLIAATALLNGLELYTRNTDDFTHIDGLTVINPFPES